MRGWGGEGGGGSFHFPVADVLRECCHLAVQCAFCQRNMCPKTVIPFVIHIRIHILKLQLLNSYIYKVVD